MSEKIVCYRIFLASPSGLEQERELIRDIVQVFNDHAAVPRGAFYYVVGWETVASGAGRPQGVINESLEACDYFLMLLWHRWGSPTETGNSPMFSSGTEEEFHKASEYLVDENRPMRDLAVFFKTSVVRPHEMNPDHWARVDAFRRSLDQKKSVLYHSFDGDRSLSDTVSAVLNKWLLTHERGHIKPEMRELLLSDRSASSVPGLLPVKRPDPDPAKVNTDPHLTNVDAGQDPERALEKAEQLLQGGRMVEAYDEFAQVLALSREFGPRYEVKAYNGFGRILLQKGELREAEKQLRAALRIARASGATSEVPQQLALIGCVLYMMEDLLGARNALIEAERTGERLGQENVLAETRNMLGLIYLSRGATDQAAKSFDSAIGIYTTTGDLRGLAKALNNRGLLEIDLGQFADAESSIMEALSINEKLRYTTALALNHLNLARIAEGRSQPTVALHQYQIAKNLYAQAGVADKRDAVQARIASLAKSE